MVGVLQRGWSIGITVYLEDGGTRAEWPDQPAVLGFGAAIAVTGELLETDPVGDRDHAALGADGERAFKYMQRYGDPGPAYRQHHAHELVRQRDVVALDPVVAHQQPAG